MSLIGDLVVPFWVKLALLAALVVAGAAIGNGFRGHWDAGDIATAHAAQDKAEAAAKQANTDRDGWKNAADAWKGAIDAQNAANAQAQADAVRDQQLATQAISAAAVAELDYKRRRAQIDAEAAKDKSQCAVTPVAGLQ